MIFLWLWCSWSSSGFSSRLVWPLQPLQKDHSWLNFLFVWRSSRIKRLLSESVDNQKTSAANKIVHTPTAYFQIFFYKHAGVVCQAKDRERGVCWIQRHTADATGKGLSNRHELSVHPTNRVLYPSIRRWWRCIHVSSLLPFAFPMATTFSIFHPKFSTILHLRR
jgi:hypothetical protein